MLQGASFIQIIMMPLVGRFGTKIDARLMISIGIGILCYSLWLNAHLTSEADNHTMVAPLFTRAIGISIIFIPLSMTALSDLPQRDARQCDRTFQLDARTRRLDWHGLDEQCPDQ